MNNNEYFKKLSLAIENNIALWQATVIECDGSTPAKTGMKLAVLLNEAPFGNLGGGEMEHRVIDLIRTEKPVGSKIYSFDLASKGTTDDIPTAMICGGQAKVFIESMHISQKLFIIGAGHCGRALGKMAKLCGFYTVLIDNREEIINSLTQDSCHEAKLHDYTEMAEVIDFSPENYVVIMTHGHTHDKEVLEQCLRKPLKYLGMIGSKTKVAQTFANLTEKGFSEAEIKACHAPIGIPIGSQTPYEIAISIMAQIIQQKQAIR
jgi:xanthine dehydrogenase accessory factor